MAYALVAHTAKASLDGEDITTTALNTTGATLLVAVLSSYGSSSPNTTPQDSHSNTWLPLTAQHVGPIRHQIFYVENPTVSVGVADHTFTTVGVTNLPSIAVSAWSGATLSAVFDQENGANNTTGSATQQAAGPVTPTEAGELIIAGCFLNPAYTVDSIAGDGFTTILDTVGTPSNAFVVAHAYVIQTTAGSANPTWTFSASAYSAVTLATFKASAVVPVAVIASASAGSADGISDFTTAPIDTTNATLLVAAISEYDPALTGSSSLFDSKGNSWSPRTIYIEGSSVPLTQIRLFYAVPPDNTKRGTGHTFTLDSPPALSYQSLLVLAAVGMHASAPYDQESGTEVNGSVTSQPGPITPSEAGELFIAALATESEVVSSIDSGFTIAQTVAGTSQHMAGVLAYLIHPTTTSVNPTWTMAASTNTSLTMAAFKAAVAGTPPAVLDTSDLMMLGVG